MILVWMQILYCWGLMLSYRWSFLALSVRIAVLTKSSLSALSISFLFLFSRWSGERLMY